MTLQSLLYDRPHSLEHQSYEPRHQRHGRVNADGFGVGWYDHERRPEPARYRSTKPMWADRSFASVAGLVAAGAVLAAVRNATPPSPVEESGTPPFGCGPWLFAHNGAVDGFRGSPGLELRKRVSERRLAAIEGAADSEVLFAMALDALDAGAAPGRALATVVATATATTGGRLNLVLTDGRALAATAFGDSLFVRTAPGTVLVASEPDDDDPAWSPVPERSLVEATAAGRAVVTPLSVEEGT